MFSADMQKMIDKLKQDGEQDSDVVKKALRMSESFNVVKAAQGEKEKPVKMSDLSKNIGIVSKMSEAGFPHEKATAIIKAIFVDPSDANLDAAFDTFDADKNGFITADEMKAALPLLGDCVPEDKVADLMKGTVEDKDGKVDKVEFRRLVKAINAEDGMLTSWRKSWDAHWKAISEKVGGLIPAKKPVADTKDATQEAEKPKEEGPPPKSVGEKVKDTLTTTPEWAKQLQENTNAWALATKAGISWTLGPAEQTKIGKVITRMKDAEYSEESAVAVVKALFTDCSEEELKAAFDVFSAEGKESMSKDSFIKAIPLMGEDVPADKVDEAFKAVDTNDSGELDLSEFTKLVEILNPRKTKKAEEAAADAAEPSAAGPTLADRWTDFTSRFTAKKEEAQAPAAEAPAAEAPAAEAPEAKEPEAKAAAEAPEAKAEPAPAAADKAAQPGKAEPEKTPAATESN